MKKLLSFIIIASIIANLGFAFDVKAEEEEGGWYLTNYEFVDVSGSTRSTLMGTSATMTTINNYNGQKGNIEIGHNRYSDSSGDLLHGLNYAVSWSDPPNIIRAGEKVSVDYEIKIVSTTGSWTNPDQNHVYMSHKQGGRFTTPEGVQYLKENIKTVLTCEKAIKAGSEGKEITLTLSLGYGYKAIYTYEWKKPSTSTVPSIGNNAESFESGVRVMWQPSMSLGYRLFRSTYPNSIGISVTDFYITSTSYADVNVEPDTTYYYTVKPVISEANPFQGIEEKLGNTIATYIVTTGKQLSNAGSYKHFIMLKLNNPNMSIDGIEQEVDPGRGTAPMTISGRTMVPIRAIVEAMGGTVGWDSNTQKITLKARGNTVEMWMNKKDIKVNGVSKGIDVAPVSKNSRTFVPVRFAAENLNCKVDWINSTKEAVIIYEE